MAPDTSRKNILDNENLVENAGRVFIEPGKPWGRGLVQDFKSTVGTHWWSEMTNFNQKTVAVSALMFITVIAPTLTFGAVYGRNTENHIGAVETILSTCWVGVFMSFFSGMPTVVIGSTGPVLIMSTVIYEMTKNMDIPFLPFYAWVSIWTFGYTTITAFFDLTRYVRFATRFTDDIFALLIVSIFILNAIGSPFGAGGLLRYLDPDNEFHDENAFLGDDYSKHETALLAIILGLGTTSTIFFLRGFKTSGFCCNQDVRNSVHDFAVTLSVVIWAIIGRVGFPDIEIPGLNVPDKFEPTYACCDSSCSTFWPDQCEDQSEPWGTRPWFAEMGNLNGKSYAPFLAAGPAVLSFILFYLDNGITWHLIYDPANGLQHGESYNWDLFLNGLSNMINGLLGLPWLVATTVPCIVHLNNLAEKDKDGKVITVQETRLTYFFSHMLVGLSLLFLNAIKQIPLPVLLGVFLFMGLSSMPGIQFWQRFLMFFMQPSKFPEKPFTKYISPMRIHMYTVFQIVFFLGVFFVQNTPSIAIVFPFMTLLCIPARLFLAPRFFYRWELCLLDGYEEEVEEWVQAKERAERDDISEVLAMEEGGDVDLGDNDKESEDKAEVDA
mmetsp:Transcript_86963/g.251180  ORF Transcript_86963/g.251180 Transcript_86963/m.251180 type:complete len:609 (+) Transcript_86963:177-2003(+)